MEICSGIGHAKSTCETVCLGFEGTLQKFLAMVSESTAERNTCEMAGISGMKLKRFVFGDPSL